MRRGCSIRPTMIHVRVQQIYQLSKGEVKMVQEIEKKEPFKCGTFGASAIEDRFDVATFADSFPPPMITASLLRRASGR